MAFHPRRAILCAMTGKTDQLKDEDYQTLAAIRAALRRFTHFSEEAAKTAGVTPQQHQALLAVELLLFELKPRSFLPVAAPSQPRLG